VSAFANLISASERSISRRFPTGRVALSLASFAAAILPAVFLAKLTAFPNLTHVRNAMTAFNATEKTKDAFDAVLVAGQIDSRPLSQQEMRGGFWRVDGTFTPSLHITNILENTDIMVTPVLYASDGEEYDLQEVHLSGGDSVSIDIRAALHSAPGEIVQHFSEYGSAGIKYQWHWSGAVVGMVQNLDVHRSLNFNYQLHTPGQRDIPVGLIRKEGVWWKEDSGVTGVLGLTNISAHRLAVVCEILNASGAVEQRREVLLKPLESQQFGFLQDIQGAIGGVRVSYSGNENDLAIASGLENVSEGYSARIPFTTVSNESHRTQDKNGHRHGNKTDQRFAIGSVGLMLGAPDPMMAFPSGTTFSMYFAARNTMNNPVEITPTLYFMSGTGPETIALPPVTLQAEEARYWGDSEILGSIDRSVLPSSINVVFSYAGADGGIVMSSGSIDQTKNYVFEIEMQSLGASHAKSLKEWSVANGNDTMISLLNSEQRDQDLLLALLYDGGRYIAPIHLKAGASAMLDVGEIIHMRQADIHGNLLPSSVSQGSAVVYGAGGQAEWINVGASVGIFNVIAATCGTTCPTCLGYTSFFVQAQNSTAPVGQSATFKAIGILQNGNAQDVTTLSSWDSSNSNIATSQSHGSFTGVAPGTFSAEASASLLDYPADCPEGPGHPCPASIYFGSAQGTIKPRIDSISPSRGIQGGTTSSVTIGGAGLTGATVSAGTGITVTVRSASSSTVVADFAAASSATPGNHSVTITAGGQTSSPTNFFIQVPTKLSIISGTDSTTAEASCPVGSLTGCGMHRSFTYQIMDQQTPAQPINTGSLQFWDVLQTTSPNNLGISGYLTTCPGNTGPCGVTTSLDGRFQEANLGVCSTVCRVNNACTTGGPTNANQTWHIGTYAIVQQISYYCNHVTVNGQ
jgi:hypothetical protein